MLLSLVFRVEGPQPRARLRLNLLARGPSRQVVRASTDRGTPLNA